MRSRQVRVFPSLGGGRAMAALAFVFAGTWLGSTAMMGRKSEKRK